MSTPPPRPPSSGGAPAGMPSRLWEAAKHGDRGSIPPWVQAAPDASATAPPHISQAARRAAQVAAVAGAIGGGIGVGMGVGISAAAEPSRTADLTHASGGAPATEHISVEHVTTDHVGDSLTSSVSGDGSGPPGSGSEGVTLHTSGHGDHVSSGLHTTWRIPGHSAARGEHEGHGAEVVHDGLTIEIYQDVEVNQGADGMYSVDAVEYVVVRDEHGHSYVFSDNYHTVVPDPPGQETDLVIHETDHIQVTEHPDGSFSVNQADNSISVTAGADGDGSNQVTVTQTETVQIGHVPNLNAHGQDTSSLTEIEDGGTTSNQTEVVASDAPLPPGQESAGPATPGGPTGTLGITTATTGGTTSGHDPGTPTTTVTPTTSTTSGTSAIPGTPTTPGTPGTPATSGHELSPPSTFTGLHGGQITSSGSAAQTGHFPGVPISPPHPAGGSFDSTSSSAGSGASNPFQHPAPDPPADASSPDPHQSTTLAGHDQPGLDDTGAHAVADPAVDPSELSAHDVGSYEDASAAHPDSLTVSADPAEHHAGTDTTAIH
jgi:hypothetical protein